MRETTVAGSVSAWHTSLKWLLKKEKVASVQLEREEEERKEEGKERWQTSCGKMTNTA